MYSNHNSLNSFDFYRMYDEPRIYCNIGGFSFVFIQDREDYIKCNLYNSGRYGKIAIFDQKFIGDEIDWKSQDSEEAKFLEIKDTDTEEYKELHKIYSIWNKESSNRNILKELKEMGTKKSLCMAKECVYEGLYYRKNNTLIKQIEDHPNHDGTITFESILKELPQNIELKDIMDNAFKVFAYSERLAENFKQNPDLYTLKMEEVILNYNEIYASMFVRHVSRFFDYIFPHINRNDYFRFLHESEDILNYTYDKIKKLEKDFEDAISPGGIAYKKAEERFEISKELH